MAVSRFQPRLDINGIIDTSQSVLENMNRIADNSAMYLTYDTTQGKWSVILNRRETDIELTAPTFDDSNIVGSINIARSSLTQSANSAKISYPNLDLRGDTDEVYIYIPEEDFLPNETRKELSLGYDLINNQVQAAIVGRIDLKQGRSDRIVTFKTDYTSLGAIKPGQLLLLTTDIYGYDQKIFRAITIEEIEGDDGELLIEVTALEYDDNVYGETGIVREERNKNTGLKPAAINECIIDKELDSLTEDLNDIAEEGGRAIANKSTTVFQARAGYFDGFSVDEPSVTDSDFFFGNFGDDAVLLTGLSFTIPTTGYYNMYSLFDFQINFGLTAVVCDFKLPPTGWRWRTAVRITKNGEILSTNFNSNNAIYSGLNFTPIRNYNTFLDAQEGDVYEFDIKFKTDWTPAYTDYSSSFNNHKVRLTLALDYIGETMWS